MRDPAKLSSEVEQMFGITRAAADAEFTTAWSLRTFALGRSRA